MEFASFDDIYDAVRDDYVFAAVVNARVAHEMKIEEAGKAIHERVVVVSVLQHSIPIEIWYIDLHCVEPNHILRLYLFICGKFLQSV